jgi:hypothetical protein
MTGTGSQAQARSEITRASDTIVGVGGGSDRKPAGRDEELTLQCRQGDRIEHSSGSRRSSAPDPLPRRGGWHAVFSRYEH